MWMITPFVMALTGSQKTPILVIETGTFHRNVIRRISGPLHWSHVLVNFHVYFKIWDKGQ